MEPLVGIVLVNYNGEKFQNDCIESIKKMSYKNYKIIVVDNDSKDSSIEHLKKHHNDVICIENNENLGVAKGNNVGINYALNIGAEYILLLNNDTVVHETMLSNLVEKASETTAVAAKTYYYEPNNILWYAGGEINWYNAKCIHYGLNEVDSEKYNEYKYVEYSPTCCLLIHRNIFMNIGLMKEEYFMYYDDTDFCASLIKAGMKILYNPKAVLWHKVSSSSGGNNSPIYTYYANRNRLYFIDEFYKRKTILKEKIKILKFIQIIIYKVKGKKEHVNALKCALRDYNNEIRGKWSS